MVWLFLLLPLWAQEVIVPSADVEALAFEQHLLENPNQKSFTQDYLKKKPVMASELFHYLKKAQYEFIDGSLDEARLIFEKIVELRHKEDWDKNQRQTILYSFFRLSQLQTSEDKKEYYLHLALIFDEEIPPDEKLFPPPLLANYYKLKKKMEQKVWPLPIGMENFKTILINGRILSHQGSFFKSTPGEKRFTFISDKYAPVTISDNAENISSRKIALVPMVQGNCSQPQFNESIKDTNVLGFFSKDCILPAHLPSIGEQPFAVNPSQEPPSQIRKSTKYSTWLWLGLGVVTTALAWKLMDDQNRSQPAPTVNTSEKHFSNSEAARY